MHYSTIKLLRMELLKNDTKQIVEVPDFPNFHTRRALICCGQLPIDRIPKKKIWALVATAPVPQCSAFLCKIVFWALEFFSTPNIKTSKNID
jgi:hypothetical protein